MKRINDQDNKTLEHLEKDNWGAPSDQHTYLVYRTMELRRIPLNKFTTEDLRIMIGQGFSLFYLLPLAYEILKMDLYVKGNYYPGDLLNMVLPDADAASDGAHRYVVRL